MPKTKPKKIVRRKNPVFNTKLIKAFKELDLATQNDKPFQDFKTDDEYLENLLYSAASKIRWYASLKKLKQI